ncbi:MAG: hypothetical protein QOH31_1142 [Verrucomicrobiota bacterium]|jgi:hypothetical protein
MCKRIPVARRRSGFRLNDVAIPNREITRGKRVACRRVFILPREAWLIFERNEVNYRLVRVSL